MDWRAAVANIFDKNELLLIEIAAKKRLKEYNNTLITKLNDVKKSLRKAYRKINAEE